MDTDRYNAVHTTTITDSSPFLRLFRASPSHRRSTRSNISNARPGQVRASARSSNMQLATPCSRTSGRRRTSASSSEAQAAIRVPFLSQLWCFHVIVSDSFSFPPLLLFSALVIIFRCSILSSPPSPFVPGRSTLPTQGV